MILLQEVSQGDETCGVAALVEALALVAAPARVSGSSCCHLGLDVVVEILKLVFPLVLGCCEIVFLGHLVKKLICLFVFLD